MIHKTSACHQCDSGLPISSGCDAQGASSNDPMAKEVSLAGCRTYERSISESTHILHRTQQQVPPPTIRRCPQKIFSFICFNLFNFHSLLPRFTMKMLALGMKFLSIASCFATALLNYFRMYKRLVVVFHCIWNNHIFSWVSSHLIWSHSISIHFCQHSLLETSAFCKKFLSTLTGNIFPGFSWMTSNCSEDSDWIPDPMYIYSKASSTYFK